MNLMLTELGYKKATLHQFTLDKEDITPCLKVKNLMKDQEKILTKKKRKNSREKPFDCVDLILNLK